MQMPQPIHSRSEMKAIFDSGATSMQSFPVRTTGHDFLHSCRHFWKNVISPMHRNKGAETYPWLTLFRKEKNRKMKIPLVFFVSLPFTPTPRGHMAGANLIRAHNRNTMHHKKINQLCSPTDRMNMAAPIPSKLIRHCSSCSSSCSSCCSSCSKAGLAKIVEDEYGLSI